MPGPSGISTKTIGLIAAAVLSLVFILVIWIAISSAPKPTPTNADLFPSDPTEIPNIEDTQTGGAMLVTMVDKEDPTRVAATLKADRFEPIGEGRRRLDNPESWIYLNDARAVKITADFATMLMPDPNEPPESGTLEGNIRIEIYPDADNITTPELTAIFDQPVEFERRYLRLRSLGHFNITSEQFDFAGSDLTIILNELRDRVELIDVAQGDQIVIHTNNASKNNPQPSQSQSSGNSSNSQAQHAATTAVENTTPDVQANLFNRYHITLDDQVLLAINRSSGGSANAMADRLELWAALDGSTLPSNAIMPISFAKSSSSDQPTTPTNPQDNFSATSPSTSSPTHAASNTLKNNDDIVITWSGKLSVRPIDGDLPSQLIDNDLTLSLAANKDNGITFTIPDQGFTGQAFAMSYHATQGVLELDSAQTDIGIIKLAADQSGSLIASSLKADLSTGQITINKRGQITSTPKGPSDLDSQSTIQWKNNASFTLAKVNDALSDRLTKASFEGNVIAKQAGNSLGARSLEARLDPTLPPAQSLTKLTMNQGVLSSASRSMLSGTTVEIDFAPSATNNTAEPTKLIADGQAFGRNAQSMLKADRLEATMYRDIKGDIAIQTADAKGSIKFTGVDRTTAQGNTLAIDAVNEKMTLLGSPAKVAQGGSSIVGDHINLNARHRAIEVLGPGSFDHDIILDNTQPNALATGHIRATWKGSMRFDDALGSVICEDQVRVVSTPDAFTRDTLDAHRAEIKLTPMPTNDPIAGGNRRQPKIERELLTARIFGHAPVGLDAVPAKIESRTYDQNDLERVIGLIYLEGSQILADNQEQTLNVPASGTLLIMDRSEGDPDQNESPVTNQGLTRFAWEGNMNLNRALGTARFVDDVVVRQKTISTGKIASLSTDVLDARFEIGQQEGLADQEQATRLLGVDAAGSVRFLYEGKELLADSAIYDAVSDSLFASAIDNKLVTLYDDAQPAPMSAKTMKWQLAIDRIEINAPTPTRSTGN